MGKYRELAAAIRKGIQSWPVKGTQYFDGCALCCAMTAKKVNLDELIALCPILDKEIALPGESLTSTLRAQISWLNGHSRGSGKNWSREQIADWLETLEPRISDDEFTARFISEVVESVKSQEVAEVK